MNNNVYINKKIIHLCISNNLIQKNFVNFNSFTIYPIIYVTEIFIYFDIV